MPVKYGAHKAWRAAIDLAMQEADLPRPSGRRHLAEPLPEEELSHHRWVDLALCRVLGLHRGRLAEPQPLEGGDEDEGADLALRRLGHALPALPDPVGAGGHRG